MILNELIPVLKRWIQTRALSPPMRPSPAIPHTAPVLGWLGVIPFAVCAALASTGGVVPPGAALFRAGPVRAIASLQPANLTRIEGPPA